MAEKRTVVQDSLVAALNTTTAGSGSDDGGDHGSPSLVKLNMCNKANSYIPFDSLVVGVPYKIHRFGTYSDDRYSTKKKKHQVRLAAFIDDGYLILPERFDSLIAEVENIDAEKMYIIFNGRGETNKFLNIEFIEM